MVSASQPSSSSLSPLSVEQVHYVVFAGLWVVVATLVFRSEHTVGPVTSGAAVLSPGEQKMVGSENIFFL